MFVSQSLRDLLVSGAKIDWLIVIGCRVIVRRFYFQRANLDMPNISASLTVEFARTGPSVPAEQIKWNAELAWPRFGRVLDFPLCNLFGCRKVDHATECPPGAATTHADTPIVRAYIENVGQRLWILVAAPLTMRCVDEHLRGIGTNQAPGDLVDLLPLQTLFRYARFCLRGGRFS